MNVEIFQGTDLSETDLWVHDFIKTFVSTPIPMQCTVFIHIVVLHTSIHTSSYLDKTSTVQVEKLDIWMSYKT